MNDPTPPAGARLSDQAFLEVIDRTPLVSMDLVVRDAQARVLLGLRKNEPAQSTWFVPGGRVLKGETLPAAFARLCLAELGATHPWNQAKLLGLYTHLYDSNFMGAPGVGTHYVVIAYVLDATALPPTPPVDQHGQYRWYSAHEAAADDRVHAYTKAYFTAMSG